MQNNLIIEELFNSIGILEANLSDTISKYISVKEEHSSNKIDLTDIHNKNEKFKKDNSNYSSRLSELEKELQNTNKNLEFQTSAKDKTNSEKNLLATNLEKSEEERNALVQSLAQAQKTINENQYYKDKFGKIDIVYRKLVDENSIVNQENEDYIAQLKDYNFLKSEFKKRNLELIGSKREVQDINNIIAELKNDNYKYKNNIKNDLEEEKKELINQLADYKKQLKNLRIEKDEELEKEKNRLISHYINEINNFKNSIELLRKNDSNSKKQNEILAATIKNLQTKYDSSIKDNNKRINTIASLKTSLDNNKKKQFEDYKQIISEKQNLSEQLFEYDKKVKNLNEEIILNNEKYNKEYSKIVESAKNKYKQDIQTLKDDNQANIERSYYQNTLLSKEISSISESKEQLSIELGKKINNLIYDKNESEIELNLANENFGKEKNINATLVEKLNTTNFKIEELESQKNNLNKEKSDFQNSISEYEKNKNDAEEELSTIVNELSNLDKQLVENNNYLIKFKETNNLLNKELHEDKLKFKAVEVQKNIIQKEKEELQNKILDLEQQFIEQKNTEQKNIEDVISKYEQVSLDYKKELEQVDNESIAKMEIDLKYSKKIIEKLSKKMQKLLEKKHQMIVENETIQTEYNKSKHTLVVMTNDIAKLNGENKKINSELLDCYTDIDLMDQNVEDYEEQISELKNSVLKYEQQKEEQNIKNAILAKEIKNYIDILEKY